MATVKLLTYDVYRSGMTLFKDLADETYQDKAHLPAYYLRKMSQSETPTGYDSAYCLIYRVSGDPDLHRHGDIIGIKGSKGAGVILTYVVGSTPLADDWLSDEPGGTSIVPSPDFLYLILSAGDYYNSLYRFDESTNKYIKVMDATGAGAIFAYEVTGKTYLDADWLSLTPTGSALTPVDGLLYLDMSPTKYQNRLFRFDSTSNKYVPVAGSGSGFIYAYEITGKTPLNSDWLTDTSGSSTPLTPDVDLLYLDLTVGKFENYIFRYDATNRVYVPVSGGSGSGAIYSYIVAGSTPFSAGWLSETPGGTALEPEAGPLYLVLTAGQHYSAFYRYDETDHVYILVGNARVVDTTKADYLNLPTAKQNDGTIYFITDSASSSPGKDDYIPARVTVPDNPATDTVMLWKGATSETFPISPAFYRYDGTNWVRDNLGIEGQTIQVDTMPTPVSTLENQVVQYIGASGGGYVHNFFYECLNVSGTYRWVNTKVQAGDEFQVTVMPTPASDLVGKVYQYLGTTDANYTHDYFYECVTDGTTYSWENVKVQPGEKTQFTSMPVASAEYAGKVFQYIGVTDVNYTHNYFYECIEDSSVTPHTYSWENTKVQPGDKFQYTTMPTASADLAGTVLQYTGATNTNFKHNYWYECTNASGTYKWEETEVEEPEITTISKEDFDALPTATKNNGKVYFIPDADAERNYAIRTGFTPVGTVISIMGTTPPRLYLLCDGHEYNIADFQPLADYFEDQFGSVNYFGGDGTTTFKVPNITGAPQDSMFCIATQNIYIEGRHDYSTIEKVSGVWVDGKPIYERTFFIPVPDTVSATLAESLVEMGVTVKQFIDVRGLISVDGWTTNIAWGVPNLSATGVILSAYDNSDTSGSANKVGIMYQGDMTIFDLIMVTAFYTKTTD